MLPSLPKDKGFLFEKWVDPHLLEAKGIELREEGKTIVTLNGSFDLFHAGHLHILCEASKQADTLVVALNSDESIKRYKGHNRPIIPLQHRLRMVASIGFVDYVTAFDEIDPCLLLEKIRPEVHVNGAEYRENCIEAEVIQKYGGRIHWVDRIPGISTSALIDQILNRCV